MKAVQATLEAAGQQEGEDVQESLVQQALLRSCSHPALVAGAFSASCIGLRIKGTACIQSGQGEVLDLTTISVHSYLPLWTGLLQSNTFGEQVRIFEGLIIMGVS